MDEQPTIKVTIDGHPYVLRPKELNAWQTATFEAECGLTVEEMVDRFASGHGRSLTTVAQFVYLCAMQGGQEPTFRAIAERLTYGSDVSEIELAGVDDEDGPQGLDRDTAEELAEDRAEREAELAEAGPEPSDPTSAADGSTVAAGSSSPGSDGS